MFKNKTILYLVLMILCSCATTVINNDGSNNTISKHDNEKVAELYTSAALEYDRVGAYQLGLARTDLALSYDNSQAKTYMVRGIILSHLNDLVGARDNFIIAMNKSPNDGSINSSYADFLCSIGEYKEAENYYQKSIQNKLYFALNDAKYNLAKCYLKQNLYESSNILFREVLANSSNYPDELNINLAQTYYYMNSLKLAKYYFSKYHNDYNLNYYLTALLLLSGSKHSSINFSKIYKIKQNIIIKYPLSKEAEIFLSEGIIPDNDAKSKEIKVITLD